MKMFTKVGQLVFMLAYVHSNFGTQKPKPVPVCDKPNFTEAIYDGGSSAHSPGDTVRLKCKDQYEESSPSVTCKNRRWTDPDPPCKKVRCPERVAPVNGDLVMSCQTAKCTCVYTCDDGYVYNGTSPAICLRNNLWSGRLGKCAEVVCPFPGVPDHGTILMPCRNYNCTSTYSCDEGYIYRGDTVIACQRNNTWTNTKGKCEAVRCPELPGILNGKVLQPNKSFLATATILCDDGFIYNKPDIIKRQCQGNNTWDGEAGLCEARPCPNIASVKHGILSASGGSFQDSITLQCYSGHILDGPGKVTCNVDGTWSASIGQCQQINTARPLYLIIGSITSFIVGTVILVIYICWKKHTKPISKGPDEIELLVDNITSVIKEQVLQEQHRVDNDYDRRINLTEQYVKLKLISTKGIARVQRDSLEVLDRYQAAIENLGGEDIDEDQLVQPEEYGKHILLRGRAGIGKSTLIQMLFWKWANGEWASHFIGIFFFNLRYLMVIETQIDLPTLLSLHTLYTTGKNVTSIHHDWVKKNETKIAIVLDGLDELGHFKYQWQKEHSTETLPLDWCYRILKRDCLKDATLIVTSRPFSDLNLIKPDMTVELIGLTRKGVFDFIQKNVKEHNRTRVKKTLLKNPILMSVSAITFFCAELCHILEESDNLPEHLSTYTQITAFILQRYMTRSVKSPSGKGGKMLPTLHALSTLACSGLITGDYKRPPQLIFSENDFKDANLDKKELMELRKAGLLLQTEIQDANHPNKRQVFGEFVHLSIQEFLAMSAILGQSLEQIRAKLPILALHEQFNMALLFLYGLAFNRDSVSKLEGPEGKEPSTDIKELLAITIKDVKDDLHVLQLVYESQSAALACQVGKARFSEMIHFQSTKLTVLEVMAMTFLLQHTPSAHTLRLRNVDLDVSSMKELGKFLQINQTVKTIHIIDLSVDDSWVKELMKGVQRNKTLKTLQLSCGDITDEGVDHITSALFDNNTLEELWLPGLQIGKKGAEALLAALDVNDKVHIRILSCSPADKVRIERHKRITMEY